MTVMHNVTAHITRAVRMVTSFRCGGQWHPAGSVIVFVGKNERRIVPPTEFDRMYTEVDESLAPPYPVVEGVPV